VRLAIAMVVFASVASAQLDQARTHLANADFARAVRAYDRAEANDTLDRDALVSLYEGRATAHWALGHEDLARSDLRALGSIDPEHTFPPEAPPALREAFTQSAHDAIRMSITVDRSSSSTTVSAEVNADPAGLVRSLRWHGRVADGEWQTEASATMTIDSDHVEAYVEAIGPGGAVVARADLPAAPVETAEILTPPTATPTPTTPAPNNDWLWAGIAIGAGAAVIAIVVIIAIVATLPNDATQLAPPMLRF